MKSFSTLFVLLLAVVLCSTQTFAQGRIVDDNGSFIAPSVTSFEKAPADIVGQWSPVAPMPNAKIYHTVAAADGMLYVFAGLNASSQYDLGCFKYDPATDTWTPIANFPQAKFLFGRAETVGGKIYIFGGIEGFGTGYKTLTAMIEYDPASNTYTQKTPMPTVQALPSSAVLDGLIYLIGGTSTSESVYLKKVQVYDPASDSWFSNTDYPRDTKWMGATTVGNKIVCTGGFNINYSPSRYIADTYIGEVNAGILQWTKKSDAGIGPVIFPVTGTFGGKAYFAGGRPSADQNAPATQKGFSYDVDTDIWTPIEIKPTGVQYVTQAPLIGDKLYFAGGSLASGAATAVVETYDPLAASKPSVTISATSIDRWVKRSSIYQFGFYLGNLGGADLEWSAAADAGTPWLTADNPTTGTVQPGKQGLFVFTVNPNALSEGPYTGNITITTNDTDKPTLTFTVNITVQEADVDEDINVLVEQYTGTWCQWCPYGADTLAAVTARNGNRMVRFSWHDNDPMSIAQWDAMNNWIGVTGFPTASINRYQWPGETSIPVDRGVWGTNTDILLRSLRAPVGLTISEKSYVAGTKTFSFKAKVLFHQGINADVRLNAVVTEDGFNYAQKRINTSTGVVETINPYIHKAVVMGIWPDIRGYQLSLGNSFASQTEIEQVFTFTSPHVNPDNARLNIFVHTINNDRPGPVLQAIGEPLFLGVTDVDEVPVVSNFGLRQNYPNPFNPSTNVTFDVPTSSNVRITLHDALGRAIGNLVDETYEPGSHTFVLDGANLNSGTYYLTMTAGSFVQTRTMTLVK
ncbi:MAG: Omp28-related outer membrane protein [Bacteroidota bacterium]|jgi:N-acetylneuraminic acid mutarotase